MEHEQIDQLSKLTRKVPVNIEFEDLTYTLKNGRNQQILKSINGKFFSGEINAILGPSGSGKTTLLNILAGYISYGVTGSVKINNQPRKMHTFRKTCAYIMQDDLLQPYLTLFESIMVAAKLKLSRDISLKHKEKIVEEVLELLGLKNCQDTRVEQLSGGQRKRLSIALEMVSNPSIIFLDEPTSGLDSVSVKQCIEVLRKLADQGKTIICTIHQPSVSIFEQFDQTYFLAKGLCVYNGSSSNILPFLSSIGVDCPITYSPAEYIIETVQTCPDLISTFVNGVHNGKSNKTDNRRLNGVSMCSDKDEFPITALSSKDNDFAAPFWLQFYILYGRMMLQLRRNMLMIWIQVFHHMLSGILFGVLFYGVGNDASVIDRNFKYCVSVTIFFIYTYVMIPILLFPFEVQILRREYFNRWYSLKAYFTAVSLRSAPLMIILGLSFVLITYLMTNQPLVLDRFLWFLLPIILVSLASEGLGLAIGSMFTSTNGAIVGPAVCACYLFLAVYGMGYGPQIEPYMKIIMHGSYMRHGLVAIIYSVYGNRGRLDCPEDAVYCFYKYPKQFLRDLGMLDNSYSSGIIGLVVFLCLFRIIAFLALKYRLTSEFSNKVTNYALNALRHVSRR